LELGEVSLVNRTGLDEQEIFVPPSSLKKAKNAFYAALGKAFEQERLRRLAAVAADRRPKLTPESRHRASPSLLAAASRRSELAPRAERGEQPPHPFVDPSRPFDMGELAEIGGWRFLPLPPVARGQDQELHRHLLELAVTNPNERFAVGLSNLAHLSLARELEALPNVAFFVDYYLYTANRFAVDLMRREAANLLFLYHWLEGSEQDARDLEASLEEPISLVRISGAFQPPLFYGMGCPRGQGALSGPGCRDCAESFTQPLRQGRNRFLLRVRDCTAYLYRLQ
jgi:hypothetical protein